MKKKQLLSMLSMAFYVLGVFQLADHGINALAIISIGMGTILLSLNSKVEKE